MPMSSLISNLHAIKHDLLVELESVLWMIWRMGMFVSCWNNTERVGRGGEEEERVRNKEIETHNKYKLVIHTVISTATLNV